MAHRRALLGLMRWVAASLLGSSPIWQSGIRVTLGQQLASFQNNQTQLGVRYSTALGADWKLSGKTFAYRNQFNNAYPSTERRNYFLEQSTTAQRGVVQDLYFLHKSGRQLSVNVWLTDNDLILAPKDTIARERTRTQSARFLTTYETNHLTLRLGWTHDILDYAKSNFDLPSHTETDRFISRAEREFVLTPTKANLSVNLRVGGEWSHYRTRTDGYVRPLIEEDRGDLYALLRLQTTRWLVIGQLTAGVRYAFNPPITPSLGAEYRLVQRARFGLTAKGSHQSELPRANA